MTQTLATDKQLSFLKTLAAERELSADEAIALADSTLSKVSASVLISSLLKRDKITLNAGGVVKPVETVKPGYYCKGESYFEVVLSKAGRAYAKQLTQHGSKWSWDYAKGAVATLSDSDKLTAAQAAEFGWMHGHCLRCCAELTVPESVERGYGPVCAAHLGIA